MKFPKNARRSSNIEDRRFQSQEDVDRIFKLVEEIKELQNKKAKIKKRD